MNFLPKKLIIAEESRNDSLTKKILSNLPDVDVSYTHSRNDPLINKSTCLLYTSPSPRDQRGSRMPSSA